MAGGKDFDALFRELYIPAYAVALRILGDTHQAEDAACEALARAASSWRRIQGVDYQRAWVLRVASNVAVDMLRKRRSVPVASVADEAAPAPVGEDRLLLAEALRRLPRRQREVVALRYLADMTEVQVAEHLRLSQSAVKAHCRRGLAALRDHLKGPMPDDGEEVSVAY